MIITSETETLKSRSELCLLDPSSFSLQSSSTNASSISLSQRIPLPPSPPIHHSRIQSQTSLPPTPPGYLESNRPATTITYTFNPQLVPSNSMILSAPSYASPPQEPYYISVNMNCFTPSSYITTIRRGSWDGEVMGDFEMGLTTSKKQSTVYIREREYALSDVLETSYRLFKPGWTWNLTGRDKASIYWEESSGNSVLMCFSSKDRVQGNLLAKFIPRGPHRKHGRPVDSTRLEVTPLGHDFIDDIVISALVIERVRTTPSIPLIPMPKMTLT